MAKKFKTPKNMDWAKVATKKYRSKFYKPFRLKFKGKKRDLWDLQEKCHRKVRLSSGRSMAESRILFIHSWKLFKKSKNE